jgi:cell filamentation protein
MNLKNRYDVSGLPEGEFQPGSRGKVLQNKLGITSKAEMNRVEALALEKSFDGFLHVFDKKHRFTSVDICDMHRAWLGEIYEWAGRYRTVNVSKGDFPFAGAGQIPRLMDEFERGVLRRHTPCVFADRGRVLQALAEVHVELVLIHPFREGNGRLARVVTSLMALQAGCSINFETIKKQKKQAYFNAVQAGMKRDYAPMGALLNPLLKSRATS